MRATEKPTYQKFNIAFRIQRENECGPNALYMALKYLGQNVEFEDILTRVESESSGNTWAIGLVKAAIEQGCPTDYYTTYIGVNPKNYKLDFYNHMTESFSEAKHRIEPIFEKIKLSPIVQIRKKSIPLSSIYNLVDQNSIAIFEINWDIIINQNKTLNYLGHFVILTGWTLTSVLIHQTIAPNAKSFYEIPIKWFEYARKSLGTDENILIIHKPKN